MVGLCHELKMYIYLPLGKKSMDKPLDKHWIAMIYGQTIHNRHCFPLSLSMGKLSSMWRFKASSPGTLFPAQLPNLLGVLEIG